eukprot:scaffold300852_cov10-Prasinocladus_malaysianus.AAC.1
MGGELARGTLISFSLAWSRDPPSFLFAMYCSASIPSIHAVQSCARLTLDSMRHTMRPCTTYTIRA